MHANILGKKSSNIRRFISNKAVRRAKNVTIREWKKIERKLCVELKRWAVIYVPYFTRNTGNCFLSCIYGRIIIILIFQKMEKIKRPYPLSRNKLMKKDSPHLALCAEFYYWTTHVLMAGIVYGQIIVRKTP